MEGLVGLVVVIAGAIVHYICFRDHLINIEQQLERIADSLEEKE